MTGLHLRMWCANQNKFVPSGAMESFSPYNMNIKKYPFHDISLELPSRSAAANLLTRKAAVNLTGRTLFLTSGTQKLPHPNGTPGYLNPSAGTKSYWHTSATQSLVWVWQTKYVKCVRAIANHIFDTISFGDKTMLKVANRYWHTGIDSKTAALNWINVSHGRKPLEYNTSIKQPGLGCNESYNGHFFQISLCSQRNVQKHLKYGRHGKITDIWIDIMFLPMYC